VSHRKKSKRGRKKPVTALAVTDFFVALVVVSKVVHLLDQAGVL
jgi:hypothetical protein